MDTTPTDMQPHDTTGLSDQNRRIADLKRSAAKRAHGTRSRYVAGKCRCIACRQANTAYQTEREKAQRRGDGRGLVDSKPARLHLNKLSKQGVGYKTVADAAQMGRSAIRKILDGKQERIRAHHERRILAVDKSCLADRALVSAARTWRLLNELIADGWTRGGLATLLGSKAKTPSIQFRRTSITARTAMRVELLYRAINEGRIQRS